MRLRDERFEERITRIAAAVPARSAPFKIETVARTHEARLDQPEEPPVLIQSSRRGEVSNRGNTRALDFRLGHWHDGL